MLKRNWELPSRVRRVRRKNRSQYIFPLSASAPSYKQDQASAITLDTVQNVTVLTESEGRGEASRHEHSMEADLLSGQPSNLQNFDHEVMLFDDDEGFVDEGGDSDGQEGPTGTDGNGPSSNLASTKVHTKYDVFRVLGEGKTLAGALCVVGSRRLSVWQYDVLRRNVRAMQNSCGRAAFPSYSKLQRYVFPLLRDHVYVRSLTVSLAVDVSRAGAPSEVIGPDGEQVAPTRDVKIVRISSWGTRDISFTRSVLLPDTAEEDRTLFSCIDDAAIARLRPALLSAAILFTTSRESDFEIPDWNLGGGCNVDLWLRPKSNGDLGPLVTQVEQCSDEKETFILRNVSLGRKWIVTEVSDVFDFADVVIEAEQNEVRLSTSQQGTGQQTLYVVQKMVKRPRIYAFHLLIMERSTSGNNCMRLRCVRMTRSGSDAIASPISCSSAGMLGVREPPMPSGSVGFLSDGRKYIVYKVIIFADDFDPYVGRRGSAGGCYILPVSIPISQRTGVKGIHVLSMTPPGVSTGKVLLSLIPDIVEGTVNGFTVVDADGSELQMFIDIVGYQCDYFAVQENSDLRGHNSVAPCNFCTFKRGIARDEDMSDYAYSTNIHSGNAAVRRDVLRMEALRKVYTKEDDLQSVGLRAMTDADRQSLPLHALHNALRECRGRIPKNCDGQPIVAAAFDPYLSIVIAPDHLFSNLIKDVIAAILKTLSRAERRCAHSLIRQALDVHGIRTESQYINEKDGDLYVMSMSALYSVIMVAPWAFVTATSMSETGCLSVDKRRDEDVIYLAFMLKNLIANTQFYGRLDRDGSIYAKQFTADGWRQRQRGLMVEAMRYISKLDACCVQSEKQAEELDKPNVHRLLELYVNTIPTYGHVRLYEELSLERTHQPLKRALKHSNHKNAQLQAMDHMLADEWKGRLKAATDGATRPEDISQASLCSLERSIAGDVLREDQRGVRQDQLRRVFDTTLISDLHTFTSRQVTNYASRRKELQWRSSQEYNLQGRTTRWEALRERCRCALQRHVTWLKPDEDVVVRSILRATLVGGTGGMRKYPNTRSFIPNIQYDDVLQAVVLTSQPTISQRSAEFSVKMLHPETRSVDTASTVDDTRPSFWHVADVMEVQPPLDVANMKCEVVALVLPLLPCDASTAGGNNRDYNYLPQTYQLGETEPNTGYVLPLCPGVMKPMSLHSCSGRCKIDETTGTVTHSAPNTSTEKWILYGSADGFPPRTG